VARPFRFGVSSSSAPSRQDWQAKARRAEELGYDSFVIADHLRGHLSPFVALGAVAEATSSLTLGTFVLNNDFRHPVLVAREAASLQAVTGRRFELGLGAGHSKDEYDEAGIPFDPGPVRVGRLGEAVEVIQQLFSGEPATFEGEHYRVTAHTIAPPLEQPIPVLIGGNAKFILQLAARKADIVGFTGIFLGPDGAGVDFRWFSREGLEDRLAIVREAAGKRFSQLELNVLIQGVTLTDDRAAAIEATATRTTVLTPQQIDECPYLLMGSAHAMADRLIDYRERFGISYIVTHEHGMEALAPVIALLKGR
jgi:probable F420-dependent oxidoreductase